MRSLPVQLVVVLVFALGPGQAAASDAKNPCAVPALGGAELAAEEPSGVGGTGTQERTLLAAADDDDSGMGGTGLDGADNAHGDDDSGMGGTGIVGTITGFGSICVNGLRIAYGPETPTERNGAAASADELAIGDVVNVAAKHDAATGELRASAIGVRHIVRGPIESIAVGNGSIHSSRVVQLETRDAASQIGTLERLEGGRLRVAGIDVVAELELGDDLSGQYVVVSGSWDAETRSMRSAEIAPAVSFKDMSAHEISLGGYVEESDEDGFRVGGVRVEASAGRIDRLGTIAIDDYIVIRAIVTKSGGIRAVRIALDALPPRLMIPRPPRMDRMDRVPRMDLMPRPKRAQRQRVRRPALPPSPPRPPRIDVVPRPVRVLKLISG
jgi:hypothetical protein